MSNRTEFEQLKEIIEAIPENEIKVPNMPVEEFIIESESLYNTAFLDKEKLIARGLKMKVINSLQPAVGALSFVEGEWDTERFEKEEAEKEYKQKAPEVFKFRNMLVDELAFAYDGNATLESRIDSIKKGDGHADMIQDLMTLALLGKKNTEPLTVTNFEFPLLDEAEDLSATMAALLGKANGTRDDNNSKKILRDKAYTHLKHYVDIVRKYGKFVFRDDENHAAKYASQYKRNN